MVNEEENKLVENLPSAIANLPEIPGELFPPIVWIFLIQLVVWTTFFYFCPITFLLLLMFSMVAIPTTITMYIGMTTPVKYL